MVWVFKWTTALSWAYKGTTPAKAVYVWTTKVRPTFTPRTFTISWTEQSDMSYWWTYSDDATWLTAGSWDFDDFFWYSAVLLNTSGVETAEMTQSWGVFTGAMTTLGNITSGDNVMIKFPARWIKMTKSWSVVTLSITDDLTKESEWYQYYAFQTWTLANPWAIKDNFYLGAYKWSYSSSKLKSWSWKEPTSNITQYAFYEAAKSNWAWYDIIGFYQRMYINALYMMKYWNPNAKTTVWKWYIWWSSVTSTWWTNSQTNATYWTTSTTTQCRLFWLEDRWGNINEWLWWCYTDGTKKLYTMLNWWNGSVSWWEATWTTISRTSSYYCMSAIAGDNKAMFAPKTTVNNSSYTTYYCSFIDVYESCLATAGGRWSDNNMVNTFMINFGYASGWKGTNIWWRLMYMNGLT